MAASKTERLEQAETALAREIAKRRAMLREAKARIRALEAALEEHNGVSPFAPERFIAPGPISGVRLAGGAAGVRYKNRLDVMLARVDPAPGRGGVAGVFTRSATRAAPVLWCQEKLAALSEADHSAAPFLILVNAGNANAFTGAAGMQAVAATAAAAARAVARPLGSDASADRVFVASTGVIGEPLPYERINAKLSELVFGLFQDDAEAAWESAARAIMTTDTYPKAAEAVVEVDGAKVRIAGVVKGSGMIAPDLATMLGFVFTDAAVAPGLLQKLLSDLVEGSFNAVTVDGDTSTSDMVLLAATGRSGAPLLESPQSPGYAAFRRGLDRVLKALAQSVVKDGEGISKFIQVRVAGAKSRKAAKTIALSIANSPLVKTAFAGEDANWGRIVMAVGKSGEEADRDRLSIRFGEHLVAERGWRAPDYDEAALSAYMRGAELCVTVDLGIGSGAATVWTCDLTHGYISINADYRS